MPASQRTITIANGKGGVGKTSIASHVAGLTAEAGHRVLLVELDVQGNVGEDLGYSGAGLSDNGEGLFLAVRAEQPPAPLRDVRPGLDVVPGGEAIGELTATLETRRRQGNSGGPGALARSLAPLAADYDLVLIDTPPGDALIQEEALIAARWGLIPTKTDASSRKGLRAIARRFGTARQHNPDLGLLGVVLFGTTSSATRVIAEARTIIEEELGGAAPVFASTIRHVEAAAYDVRKRGQLAHELERVVVSGPKWYEVIRNPNLAGDMPRLAASATSLAGDYQSLTTEVLTELLRTESDQAVVTA